MRSLENYRSTSEFGLNEYTQAGDSTFTYDADGNMTSRTDAMGVTTYQYDSENRLVSVSTPTNGVWQYTYDAFGIRVAVVHDGEATRYLYDPAGLGDMVAAYDGAGALLARYGHAFGLVSKDDRSGRSAYYCFDLLGNTREITDDSGLVLNAYDYDAFGATVSFEEATANDLRFLGRLGIEDEGAGLHFMRARYFDHGLGRFTTMDPIGVGGGINLLTYAQNNPTELVDPSGLLYDVIKVKWAEFIFSDPTDDGDLYLGLGLNRSLPGSWVLFSKAANGSWSAGIPGVFSVAQSPGNPKEGFSLTGNDILGPFGFKDRDRAWGIGAGASGSLRYAVRLPTRDISRGFEGVGRLIRGGVLNINEQNQLDQLEGITTQVVRPRDPNDKIGPTGIGPNQVVSASDPMEYMIRFENAASASAPVQELIVVDYLDANLDWTTVQFKEIAYGNRIITSSGNSQSFTLRDTPPTNSTAITGAAVGQMVVEANVSFNPQIGRVEWRVSAIDTNTSFFPQDALSGFLPPEDGSGRGQGYVRFSVKPRSFTPIGTGITNTASIVFDGNDAIATAPVWNLVGDVPSLSTIIAYLPGQIIAGKPFSYTLTMTNNGSATVTNVALTNSVPTGFTISSATATAGSVIITNGSIIWDIGDAAIGFGAGLTVTLIPTLPGTFTNGVDYRGGSGLAIFPLPSVITVVSSTPGLGIRLDNGQVELFWFTNFAGFHVQTTSSLSNQWMDLPVMPAVVGQEYRVTNGVPAGRQFYRLSNGSVASGTQLGIGIQWAGSQIQLFWPTNATGLHLQSAGSVGPSAVWGDVTNAPSASGGINRVTTEPSGLRRYFRLVPP